MTVTSSIVYGSPQTLTFTTNGLASTSGLLVGRQSAIADNSSTLNIDHLVGGKLVTTATTTTNTQIQVWVGGSYDGTSYSAGGGGGDSGFTPDTGAKNLMRLLISIANITTTAVTYTWGPFSVAQAFGGILPAKWFIYVVHNTGQNLATGGELKYTPINYSSA